MCSHCCCLGLGEDSRFAGGQQRQRDHSREGGHGGGTPPPQLPPAGCHEPCYRCWQARSTSAAQKSLHRSKCQAEHMWCQAERICACVCVIDVTVGWTSNTKWAWCAQASSSVTIMLIGPPFCLHAWYELFLFLQGVNRAAAPVRSTSCKAVMSYSNGIFLACEMFSLVLCAKVVARNRCHIHSFDALCKATLCVGSAPTPCIQAICSVL